MLVYQGRGIKFTFPSPSVAGKWFADGPSYNYACGALEPIWAPKNRKFHRWVLLKMVRITPKSWQYHGEWTIDRSI